MAKLSVLVGTIASGKTQYARNAAREGYVICNDDAIVNAVHAGEYTCYDRSLKPLYKLLENQLVGTALAMGRNVIVDRGLNLSLRGRQRWVSLARAFDVWTEVVHFRLESAQVHGERRFNHDPRGHDLSYWLKVAQAHLDSYVAPSLEEGFTAIHQISFEEINAGVVL